MIATAALIVAALLLAGWLYWLTNRMQQLLNRADRQQDVIDRKLALIPSKSAPRTDGAGDTPRAWLAALTGCMNATGETATPVDYGDDRLIEHPAKRRHAAPTNRKP